MLTSLWETGFASRTPVSQAALGSFQKLLSEVAGGTFLETRSTETWEEG